jgi:hypothetical protein
VAAAIELVRDYFLAMARRIYSDAETLTVERNAATIAGWILDTGATEVYVRHLQRKVRLPGLRLADDIRAANDMLADADWLAPPPPGSHQHRSRIAYPVNPLVHAAPRPNGHDTVAPEPSPREAPADKAADPSPVAAEPAEPAPSSSKAKTVLTRKEKIVLTRPAAKPSAEASPEFLTTPPDAPAAAAVPDSPIAQAPDSTPASAAESAMVSDAKPEEAPAAPNG